MSCHSSDIGRGARHLRTQQVPEYRITPFHSFSLTPRYLQYTPRAKDPQIWWQSRAATPFLIYELIVLSSIRPVQPWKLLFSTDLTRYLPLHDRPLSKPQNERIWLFKWATRLYAARGCDPSLSFSTLLNMQIEYAMNSMLTFSWHRKLHCFRGINPAR